MGQWLVELLYPVHNFVEPNIDCCISAVDSSSHWWRKVERIRHTNTLVEATNLNRQWMIQSKQNRVQFFVSYLANERCCVSQSTLTRRASNLSAYIACTHMWAAFTCKHDRTDARQIPQLLLGNKIFHSVLMCITYHMTSSNTRTASAILGCSADIHLALYSLCRCRQLAEWARFFIQIVWPINDLLFRSQEATVLTKSGQFSRQTNVQLYILRANCL
jgi:hypothetical protein